MIKILLFARLQEQVGKSELRVQYSGQTVGELKEMLQKKYNFLLDNVMVAVNEEYAFDEEKLSENDVVAFIPPVSGG
ncbi:molybdopterin converting factor subunit 1 [Priestia filamentosa]|uniref:Molybdopterin synthase sulfur carrier subunit n=1 Tax=Priestia filamentosa TaxID=1402861 RepID=A0A1X7F335_9BACI|nr:molybdopterin converting factor subunit 1 [Priestia filamentosa]AKO91617.1 molybdopterin converting factor subunit 1 [Priestia filamentosa]MDT3761728.1 molybdopterin converting factor subunit 1 [Priestia filamentosa]OXS67822.1 molybdopterin synthase sulfur carrier subunit [Priestia filamentosa]RJS64978.1 molybdopterin converting factor subunit 1 [Priestia filamentosa]WCM16824.1 molybdopterin converting factor subunit 1 [Priestia filamentosa]